MGRKNGKPGPSSIMHEQAELLAELAVVALLGLLQHVEVRVQLVLLGERSAVDALEHLVLFDRRASKRR